MLLSVLGGLGIPSVVLALVFRRFRRNGSNEIEPFSRYISQGVKYYVGRYVRRQLAAEFTLRAYARVQLRDKATKTMFVPATYPVPLDVDEVFVPLLLRGPTGDVVEYQDLTAASGSRIVVLGDPGSGKSSLMKRTFRDACRRANSDPRHSALPVFVELRKLSRLDKADLLELTAERLLDICLTDVGKAAAFRADGVVEHLQHGAGYLVLLDGLDEVPSDASKRVAEVISQLAEHLTLTSPRSSLIVSTRTQHYVALHDRLFRETFQVLALRPFSIADIYRFLLKWPFGADRRDHITRLFSRIRQLPSLTEMCTNPLALSMLVARDQTTGGALSPETRSEFYAPLVAELLVHRRLRAEEGPVGRQRLLQVREAVLGAVCLGHLLEPDEAPNSVPQERLILEITEAGYSAGEPQSVLSELAVDTGLFSAEREGESYRFLHLTLCEFLAAREVVNQGSDGWKKIAERLSSPTLAGEGDDWSSRLREVVAFACGLAPRSLRDEILADLAARADHGLLLRAAIEAQSYGTGAVVDTISKEAESLQSVGPDDWDVAWFARLRWLIAVLRDMAAGHRAELGVTGNETLPTPASYLMQLIDLYGAEDRLLATLARNDAAAAVTIAESSNRPALMDAVAAAADDFSVLVAILARCDAGRSDWKLALVHTALTQRHIATVLRTSIERVDAGPEGRGWVASFITKGSVYGQLLDDVLATPTAWRDTDRELLRRLALVKPPSWQFGALMRGAPLPAVLALLAPLWIIGFAVQLWRGGLPALPELTELSRVIVVVPVTVSCYMLWQLMRLRASRRSAMVELDVMTGDVVLGSFDDTKDESLRRSGVAKGAADSYLVRFWRVPVLEEVLNLGRYRFAVSNVGGGPDDLVSGQSWQRMRSGVHRADVEALRAARSLRRVAPETENGMVSAEKAMTSPS